LLDPSPIKLALHALSIPLPISLQLRPPEFRTGFRHPRKSTLPVSVPTAAVDENGPSAGTKHEIGVAWQILRMEPISISHGKDKSANKQLGPRTLGANPCHDLGALGWRDGIHTFYISPDCSKSGGLSSLQHDGTLSNLCKLQLEPNKELRGKVRFPDWEMEGRGPGESRVAKGKAD